MQNLNLKENSSLTKIIASNSNRTDIVPIDKITFMITPPSTGPTTPPTVFVTSTAKSILVSEEDFSDKDLIKEVFDENSNSHIHFHKFSTQDEELMELVEQDPTVLADLYQILEEHYLIKSSKLLNIIKSLSTSFAVDHILSKLLAATTEEVKDLIKNSSDTQSLKMAFMEI